MKIIISLMIFLTIGISPINVNAQLIPFQLEEKNVVASSQALENAILAIIKMLEAQNPSAQVVENKIIVNVDVFYATLTRATTGWKLIIEHEKEKPVEAILKFGQNEKIDSALSNYI